MADVFSAKATSALQASEGWARWARSEAVDPEHLLLAIADEEGAVGFHALSALGIPFGRLEERVRAGPRRTELPATGELPISPATEAAVRAAQDESSAETRIDTGHLLVALSGQGAAARILSELGADPERIGNAVRQARLEVSLEAVRARMSSLLDEARRWLLSRSGSAKSGISTTTPWRVAQADWAFSEGPASAQIDIAIVPETFPARPVGIRAFASEVAELVIDPLVDFLDTPQGLFSEGVFQDPQAGFEHLSATPENGVFGFTVFMSYAAE